MKRTVDLRKFEVHFCYEVETNGLYDEYEYGRIFDYGDGEKVSELYERIIEYLIDQLLGDWDVETIEKDGNYIYYTYQSPECQYPEFNGEIIMKEDYFQAKLYMKYEDEDGDDVWVYIPYSDDPITAVEIDM